MQSIHSQVLAQAAALLGGEAQLRAHLRVDVRQLRAWMDGAEAPPVAVFLKAVDVVDARHGPLPPARREAWEARARSERAVANSRALRERLAAALEVATRLRERVLARQLIEARRTPPLSAEAFAAARYSPAESEAMLAAGLNAAVNATGASLANVQLACAEGLRLVAHLGFKPDFLSFFQVVDASVPSTCGRAHERASRVIVSDVASDPIFVDTAAGEVMERAGAIACQSTPLVGGSGEVLGMLSTHYGHVHFPAPQELRAVDLVAARMSSWLSGGDLLARR